MRVLRICSLLALLVVGLASVTAAQRLQVDRGTRAAGLWCFPLDGEDAVYVYLPSQSRLAADEEGNPQFSLIRYVINEPGEESSSSTITQAGGGGVVHFLVLYETPEEQIAAAQQELRQRLDDDELLLRGPVVFDDGSYTLVSSILNPDDGSSERHVLATGKAPVLEGNRIALSFDLEPEQATLLMESFKMATPDISIVFDMKFSGLNDAYDAELLVDWSQVRQSKNFSAGASVYFISADVEMAFDDLRRDNAIQLRSSGSDASMEALLDNVYQKLLELMFRPVQPEQVPQDQRGGMMDALGALVDPKSGALSSRKTTGFGAYVGYQMKDLRSSGTSVLNFNHRASVERHSFITFNIGNLFSRYGDNPDYFRTVNLGDPAFQQREVHVAVDGALLPEFDKYINSVTVTLRKQHEAGATTLRELVLDRDAVEAAEGDLRMVYGWDGDADRMAWLEYEHRARWSFKGGGHFETEWETADAPMIDLFTPYERRRVELLGNVDQLEESGVRAVVVRLDYPFFSEERSEQFVLRPGRELEGPAEITLPLGIYEYGYDITWMLADGGRLHAAGRDSTGVLFVDELPD